VILWSQWIDFCCENINTKPIIMRKIALMFVFSLVFFSCEKDYLIPDNEVPDWLKTRISLDEQTIRDNPKYMASWGAWVR